MADPRPSTATSSLYPPSDDRDHPPPDRLLPELQFRPLMHAYPSLSAPPSMLDFGPRTGLPRPEPFMPQCPSARTSYTRVDFSGANTPRPHPVDLELETDEPVPELVSQEDDAKREDDDQPAPHEPQVALTFLLVSGRRRTMSFEPRTTVGRVKELAWNAWPSEWQDERPPAPSFFRILYLGKILQDDDSLSNLSLPTYIPTPSATPAANATIVHLSIRANAPSGADAAPSKKKRRWGSAAEGASPDEEREAGCCGACVIC